MNIPRFIIGPQFIDQDRHAVICQSAKLVRQVRKVLRLGNGDRVEIIDGQGNIYHCLLENIMPQAGRDFFQARIISQEKLFEPTGARFTIGLPIIKTSRFEWALEKLTEIGVDRIVPIILHRSIIKRSSDSGTASGDLNYQSKLPRWHKIIEEASEQCERASIPQLLEPIRFAEWLAQAEQSQNNTLRFICAERRNSPSLEESLCNYKSAQKNAPLHCAIAIGAEGGFTEEEIKAAISSMFIPVSLGPHILRSETAAIYALSISRALLSNQQTNGAQ